MIKKSAVPQSSINVDALSDLYGDTAPCYGETGGRVDRAYLTLDDGGSLGVHVSGDDGMSLKVWHGVTMRWVISSYLVGSELCALVQDAMPLLDRVHAGHRVEHDGNNYVGRLDDDASAASDELDLLCADADRQGTLEAWEASEWIGDGLSSWESGPLADAVAECVDALAGNQICGDISEALLDRASEYISQDRSGLTEDHILALIAGGRIDVDDAREYREGQEAR